MKKVKVKRTGRFIRLPEELNNYLIARFVEAGYNSPNEMIVDLIRQAMRLSEKES